MTELDLRVGLLGTCASVPIFSIPERYFVPPADLFRVSAALFHPACVASASFFNPFPSSAALCARVSSTSTLQRIGGLRCSPGGVLPFPPPSALSLRLVSAAMSSFRARSAHWPPRCALGARPEID